MKRKKLPVYLAPGLALLLTVLVLAIVSADPDYLYVKPGGTGDCSSWANACDLQTALTNATYGDEIWVATGTYTPTSPSGRSATFQMKAGVAIYGGFVATETLRTQRDWEANVTVLSGDIGTTGDTSDNTYHVVSSDGVTETAVLDGFSVTGGNANVGPSNDGGGGMYNINSSSPSISNTTFYSNTALYGGGMCNDNSSPALQNVAFTDNAVTRNGGGMHNALGSNPTLNDVTFSGNQADEYGGGMHNDSSDPMVVDATFENNSASYDGGGMSNDSSNPTVVNTTFKDNTATFDGGGMNDSNSGSKVTNVVFVGNQAGSDGGGMGCNSGSSSTVVNVTFYDNSATGQGGGLWSNASSPQVSNAIFWNNTAATGAQIHTINGSPSVTYSLVQDGYSGTGNVSGDSNFADATNDDFTLEPGSAAIDAGDNTAVLSDTVDLDGDNNTTELLPEDKAGENRFLDVAGTPDTGNGTAPIVDMGAYEASFVELQLTKAVEPSDAMPGQSITYTLVFSNAGSLTAQGVVITDIVPTELTSRNVISTGVAVTDSGAIPPYVWNVADLAPGTGGTITITGKVDPTLTADTTMDNSATIDTTDNDIVPTNNSDSGSTSVTVPRVQLSSDTYQVGESDGTATFTITLDVANPYADVTVQYTSSDGTATAGTDYTAVDATQTVVSGTTSANFTVSITADEVDEEDETLTLTLSNPSGATIDSPISATLTIQDDDTAGTGVDPTSLTVSEPSGSDIFTITLTSEPTATVTISMTTSNTQCSALASVALDAGNWSTGVTVTVQAVDDWIDDGDLTCVVQTTAASDDPKYEGIVIDDVTVTVQDDDTAGTGVDPTSLTVSEPSGSDTFTITLTSEPTATVTISMTTSNTQCSAPASVALDAGNWNTGVQVTVQAVDDWIDDGDLTCVVQTTAASDDLKYEGIVIDDVIVTVQDDDTAGNTVNPTSLTVSEPSGSDTFTITLTSEPTATVTISMTTSNTQCSVVSDSITLDSGNWNTGVQVTVQAVDDDFNDGTQTCIVQTLAAESADPNYDGMAVDDVTVDVEDEDEPGITVAPQALTVVEPDSTDIFTISLTSQPTATVTISMTTSNTECQILTDTITLDGSNWDVGVGVTVQAVNDDLDDEAQTCVVQTDAAVSADPDYDGTDPDDVTVSVQDDDGAGVIVNPTTVYVTEGGTNDIYLLRLTSEPTATVTITVTTDGQTTVISSALTFTAANWSNPQIVTVYAVDNTIADGNRTGTITHTIASDDPNYMPGAVTISDVTAQITDNDSVPAVDFDSAQYTVDEGAGTATITVTLSKPYSLTVTVAYTTSNGTAVSGSDYVTATGTLTFTPGTTVQTFDVTITDDALYDPEETIILNLGNAINAAISGGNTPATLTITDDDKGYFVPLVLRDY